MQFETFKKKLINAAFDKNFNQTQVEKLIEKLFIGKPIPTIDITHPFICRCRYNYNGEVYKNVAQLSYNPKAGSIGLQRCNYPKQQVFYGALESNNEISITTTAILETCREYIKMEDMDTHYMTLSRWQITRPLLAAFLPYSKKSQQHIPDFKKGKMVYDKIIENYGAKNNVSSEMFKSCLELISDIFCEYKDKTSYYKISSAYYNFIMTQSHLKSKGIDGLVYPSANAESAGVNIVLKTALVNNKVITCDYAVMYKAQRTVNDRKEFTFTKCSNSVDIDMDGNFSFNTIW